MKRKNIRRRIRQRLAPAGSLADHWFKRLVELIDRIHLTSLLKFAFTLLPAFIRHPLRNYLHQRKLVALIPLRSVLQKIIQQQTNIQQVVVFPPSLDWYTQLFQRPQQLALALARQGALVFYIQPKVDPKAQPFEQIEVRMYLCNVPVETFWDLYRPWIYLLTWNYNYAAAFRSPRILYDFVDEIETFAGDHKKMRHYHEELIKSAAVVMTTAERLYRQVILLRADVFLCPNGVYYEHFAHSKLAPQGTPPKDLESILSTRRPVVGYYGALATWFDYDLLYNLAIMRSDLSFVLIGPDYDSTLPPRLLDLPNMYWLGVKAYQELPSYLRFFDIATIPFQLNDITHSTSPLKLFEYMAASKPVVITPMHESTRYPGVLIASDVESFSKKIDEALKLRFDHAYLELITSVARENTWDVRAKQILSALS